MNAVLALLPEIAPAAVVIEQHGCRRRDSAT